MDFIILFFGFFFGCFFGYLFGVDAGRDDAFKETLNAGFACFDAKGVKHWGKPPEFKKQEKENL